MGRSGIHVSGDCQRREDQPQRGTQSQPRRVRIVFNVLHVAMLFVYIQLMPITITRLSHWAFSHCFASPPE